MGVEIRRATEVDIDDVTCMAASWEAEDIMYGQTAEDYDWFRERLAHYFFVADNDGEVVGYAQGERQVHCRGG